MTRSGTEGARRLAAAAVQVSAALAAHTAAAGCLPPAAALAVTLPTALLAVLAVTALLRAHPLLALTAGQLAVHACLTAAACSAAAAHLPHAATAHSAPHLLMTGAHVGALLLCRASADVVLRTADAAAETLTRLVRPRVPTRLRLPELPAPRTALRRAPRRRLRHFASAPRRGPPAASAAVLPA
jgi:hypothetical protein